MCSITEVRCYTFVCIIFVFVQLCVVCILAELSPFFPLLADSDTSTVCVEDGGDGDGGDGGEGGLDGDDTEPTQAYDLHSPMDCDPTVAYGMHIMVACILTCIYLTEWGWSLYPFHPPIQKCGKVMS